MGRARRVASAAFGAVSAFGVLSVLGCCLLACAPRPARAPEETQAARDRRDMQHVFRIGAAQIAATAGDPRGAFTGYRAFLEGCEPDPGSEVCSRNRGEAVLGGVRALARIDAPDQAPPVERARVLLDRLHDGAWVPKRASYTLEMHACAWREIASGLASADVVAVAERALANWPASVDTPVLLHRLAVTWIEVAGASAMADSERRAALARAEKRRGELASLVLRRTGESPEGTPAEGTLLVGLLTDSLTRAAEERESRAASLSSALPWRAGLALEDDLLRAVAEWSAAAAHREELLRLEEGSPAAAMTRVRLAEVRVAALAARGKAGRTPPQDEIGPVRREAEAVCAAAPPDIAGRACQIAIDLALLVVEDDKRLFAEYGGKKGRSYRTEIAIDEASPEGPRPVKVPVPELLASLLAAMDAFALHATARQDAARANEYRALAADHYFFHGELAEARKRLEAMHLGAQAEGPFACKAWSRLHAIASLEQDIESARRTEEALFRAGCTRVAPRPAATGGGCILLSTPWQLLERARRESDPESQRRGTLEAAESYEKLLLLAPRVDEAVEAAFNGAYAYKLGGRIEEGIRLYEIFVSAHASEPLLEGLERTDSRRYQERLRYLLLALEGIAGARVIALDFDAAATAYQRIAGHARFSLDDRRRAAINAVLLRAALGEADPLVEARALALTLKPTLAERAKMDFAMATAGPDPGPPSSADTPSVRAARKRRGAALEKLVAEYDRRPEAAPYVLRAAYRISMYSESSDPRRAASWCKKVEEVSTGPQRDAGAPKPRGAPPTGAGGAAPVAPGAASVAARLDPSDAALVVDCASRRATGKKASPAAPPPGKTLLPPISGLAPMLPVLVR